MIYFELKFPLRSLFLVGIFCCLLIPQIQGAADFKIRYNAKFPCLEVMDGKAEKITDISEGTQSELVTSGKSSIKLSFIKNGSGQPEVTIAEAKSALSEMELEAFGLSVGMKPAGVVTVRFGADNKPKFEMDRTGGARFLMADLGNLDTAAGKELVTSAQDATVPPAAQNPEALARFRQRISAWKTSQGGWSQRPGKILKLGGSEKLQLGTAPFRPLLEGEAVQVGGLIETGSKQALIFQSGPGVMHQAQPGSAFSLAPLEKGTADLVLELHRGTLSTCVATPLKAPRVSLIRLGDGIVARTQDALFEISKDSQGIFTLCVLKGKVVLADVAGGGEKASVTAGQKLVFHSNSRAVALSAQSPEAVSLRNFPDRLKGVVLLDILQDGFAACPEAGEEIFRELRALRPDLITEFSPKALRIHPESLAQVRAWSGNPNLQIPAKNQAQLLLAKVDQWLKTESGAEARVGKILELEGEVKGNGKNLALGQTIEPGYTLSTGPNSSLAFVASPGIIGEMKENSKGVFLESKAEFRQSTMVSSFAKLKSEVGDFRVALADGAGEKIRVEMETPKGVVRSQSTPTQTGEAK